MLIALQKFGLKVLARELASLTLRGVGRDIAISEPIEAAGSGMLFRMSAALASLVSGTIRIQCSDSLFSRDSLLDEAFFSHLGIHARRTEGNVIEISKKCYIARIPMTTRKSTQFASFALFVAPFLEPSSILIEAEAGQTGYIDMTIQSMARLNSTVTRESSCMTASPYRADDIVIDIPSDFTSLSYIASSVLSIGRSSSVTINDYYPGHTLNERTLFGLYGNLGVGLAYDERSRSLRVTREESVRGAAEVSLSELPSVAANLIAATSNLGERIRFSGVSGINNHKCQRAFVINENIRAMGGQSSLLFNDIGMFDQILIEGRGPLNGGAELSSYRDHRICAANIIAALGAKQKTIVRDTDKLDDGFPDFIEMLRTLGAEIA